MSAPFYKAMGGRIFSTSAALIAGVGSMKLYGHYLQSEVYGAIVVALTLIDYLIHVDGGFRTTVNRALLAEKDSQEHARLVRFCQTLYTWVGLLVLLLALLLMAGYSLSPQADAAGQGVVFFLVLAITGAFAIIGAIQTSLLIGLEAQSVLFTLFGIRSLGAFGALWAGLSLGADVWAFPISQLAGSVVSYPFGFSIIRRLQPGVRFFSTKLDASFWHYFHRFKRDAWACFRSQISILLLFTADLIFVGFLCGAKIAGSYGVLARVVKIVRSFIQSSGEAAWPIVAKHGLESSHFSQVLIRANAWIYGSMTGVAIFTFPPFLEWFMGAEWQTSRVVLYLVVLRFLVTGISSTVAYVLYGLGEFKMMTRWLERELLAASVLAVILGSMFGAAGVSGGFLLSTVFGTAWPLVFGYAKCMGLAAGSVLGQIWWRALLGMAVSSATATLLLSVVAGGPATVIVGVASFGATMIVAGGLALGRARRQLGKGLNWENLNLCLRNI